MGQHGVGITRKRSLERFLAKFSCLPESLCRLYFTALCFLFELCSVAIFERDELLREPSRKIQREFVEPLASVIRRTHLCHVCLTIGYGARHNGQDKVRKIIRRRREPV
jgi:hypothetical protein